MLTLRCCWKSSATAQLPPLDPVNTAEDFAQLQDRSIGKYLDFMAKKDILPIKPYYEQALRERVFDVLTGSDAQLLPPSDASRADDTVDALLSLLG